jgi:hypothetical protein
MNRLPNEEFGGGVQFLYQALQDASSDNQMLLADENPSTISGRSSNAPQFSRCSSTALEDCAELWKGREQGGLFGWTVNHPEKGFSQIWLQLIEQSVEAMFFFSNFLMLLQKWWSATRGFSQIWLQDKQRNRKSTNPITCW